MNPDYDGISDTARDLGAWAADVSEVSGIDEISLSMKAAAVLHDAFMTNYVHQSAPFVTGDETVFQNDAMTVPQVIGGVHTSAETTDAFQSKSAFEDDQRVPPQTIGE